MADRKNHHPVNRKYVPTLIAWLSLLLTAAVAHAELPSQVSEALAGFTTDAPAGWAYTLTTRRGGEISVERYDPSAADGRRWTLLQHNGKSATPEEIDRYSRYRVTTNAMSPRATFRRGDINTSSLTLIGRTAEEEQYTCTFRSDVDDPLLNRLELRLWIAVQPTRITRYSLHLLTPYSPILGMKVENLEVTVTLSPPGSDRSPLPLTSHSIFHGRFLLLKSVDEEVEVSYSAFERRSPTTYPDGIRR